MNAQKLAIAIGILKEKTNDKELCTGTTMHLPIVEIDGVKNINCTIEIYQKGKGVAFCVRADFKYDGEEDEGEESPRLYWKSKYNDAGLTKDDILDFSQKLLEELPQLRLSHYGNLSVPDKEGVSLRSAFEDVFSCIECETIKVDKLGVCSVCYEKTDTKTPCEHPLCNRCWSKIKIDRDECQASCPLCRENIFYI